MMGRGMSDVKFYKIDSFYREVEVVQPHQGEWVKKVDYDDLMKAFDEERESNKNTGIAECHTQASEVTLLKKQLKDALKYLRAYHNTPFPLEVKVCYGDEIDQLLKVEV
jgi:hypothetical protein